MSTPYDELMLELEGYGQGLPAPTPAPTAAPTPTPTPTPTDADTPYDALMRELESYGTPLAPTEAGGADPSSARPASVSGPLDTEAEDDALARPGVQSEADYTVAAGKTATGFFGYGQGPTAKFAGRMVKDVYSARKDLSKSIFKKKREEFQAANNRMPDVEETKSLLDDAGLEADEYIKKEFMGRRGMEGDTIFMDIDPHGRIAEMGRQGEESTIARVFNPFRAAFQGVDIAYTEDVQGAPQTLSYNEGGFWGNFDWLTRMTPGTLISTAQKAAGVEGGPARFYGVVPFVDVDWVSNIPKIVQAWGSEEHIKNIAEGRELISEASDINVGMVKNDSFLDNLFSPVTEAVFGLDAADTSDYMTAFGLSLFDPDVFYLGLGPGAKVAKGVGKAMGITDAVSPAVKAVARKLPGTEAFRDAKIDELDTAITKISDDFDAAFEAGVEPDKILRDIDKSLSEADMSPRSREALKLALLSKMANLMGNGAPLSSQSVKATDAIHAFLIKHREQFGEPELIDRYVVDAITAERASEAEEIAKGTVRSVAEDEELVSRATELRHLRKIKSTIKAATPEELAEVADLDRQDQAAELLRRKRQQILDAPDIEDAAKQRSIKALDESIAGIEALDLTPAARTLSDTDIATDLAGSVKQVREAVLARGDLDLEDLQAIRSAEVAGKNRKSVAAFIDSQIQKASLPADDLARLRTKRRVKALQAKQSRRSALDVTDFEQMSDLRIASELTGAQLRHYAISSFLSDARASQTALKALSKSVSKPGKLYRAGKLTAEGQQAVDDLDVLIKEAFDKMNEAMLEYRKASPDIADAAKRGPAITRQHQLRKEYQKAADQFQVLAAQKVRLLGDADHSRVDKYVNQLVDMEKEARDKMDNVYKAISTRESLAETAEASRKLHDSQIRKTIGFEKKKAKGYALGTAKIAIDTLQDQFRSLRSGEKSAQALAASNLVRTIEKDPYVAGLGLAFAPARAYAGLSNMMQYVMHPAKNFFGTDSDELAQIGSDAFGYFRQGQHEAAKGAAQFDQPLQQIDWLTKWLTTSEALPIGRGVSIHNVSNVTDVAGAPKTLWGTAYPILMHLASKPEALGETPKAVRALARMFAPDALGRLDPKLGAKMVLTALKKSEGDIEQFMARIRVATYRARGIGRKKGVFTEGEAQDILEAATGTERYETLAEASERILREQGPEDLQSMLREEAKAWNILTNVVAHADTIDVVASRTMQEIVRKKTADMGIDYATGFKAMENFFDPVNVEKQGFDDALAIFEALGMRGDQKEFVKGSMERMQAGVLALGDQGVIPRAMLDALEGDMGRLVKSFELYTATDAHPIESKIGKLLGGYAHYVNASLVTGVLFPKPLHFMNILFGNFGQIWGTEGFGTAVRTTVESLNFRPLSARHLPEPVARSLEGKRAAMAQALGVPPGNVLPDTVTVVTNPRVAEFFDTRLVPNDVEVAPGMTMGYLRQVAKENGVLSSFAGSTGLKEVMMNVASDSGNALTRAMDVAKTPKRAYADAADALEQRQRVAMFLDLVANKKIDPAEAATRVKAALYDWNSPLTYLERNFLSRILMFWTFQRKALGQGANILASAFDPTKGQLTGVLKNSSAYAKTKDMSKAVRTFQVMQRDAQQQEAEENDAFSRVYPWWAAKAGSKEWMYTEKMDPRLAASLYAATGKRATHEAYTLPAFTPLEMTNIYFELTKTALSSGLVAAGEQFLMASGGRLSGPAMQGLFNSLTGESQEQWRVTGGNEYAIVDRKIVGALNAASFGLFGAYNDKEKNGAVRLTPFGQAAYTLISPLSYEAVQFLEPMAELGTLDQDWMSGVVRMARQWSGIYRSYYYDAEKLVEQDVKSTTKAAGRYQSEMDRRGVFTWSAPVKD